MNTVMSYLIIETMHNYCQRYDNLVNNELLFFFVVFYWLIMNFPLIFIVQYSKNYVCLLGFLVV